MNNKKTISIVLFFSFLSFLTSIWAQENMFKADRMGWTDKVRMINISEIMIKDAQMRIRQMLDVRNQHSNIMAFDIGVVMGNIREKYRRMVETYREYRDKHSGRSTFFPPSYIRHFASGYFIIAMQLVHVQEVEIDRLVHVLESIDDDNLNPDPRYEGIEQTRRKRYMKLEDLNNIRRMAEEQELKSSYREQHLLRRLNLQPAQHTTGKRFQRQWPVDENWELGAYGDMGLYAGH